MSDTLVMAGLGRSFTLGMLYDARREKLIPGFSLFGDETLKKYESTTPQRSSEFQVIASDSIESKASGMDIEASLSVSFLSGLVEVGGSAKYLNDTKKYQNQSRVTLKYKATTNYKQFTAPPGKVKVQETAITDKGVATHVVTGILYGANAFFVFDSEKLENSNLQDIEGKMEAVIKKIPTVSIEGSGSVKLTNEEKSLTSSLSCKFHGDFILEHLPTTFEDAVKTYQKLPELLGEDGADAVPVKVWLVPLRRFYSKAQQLVREINVDQVKDIQNTLEELYQLKRRCNDAVDDKIVRKFPLIHDRVCHFQQMFQDYIHIMQQTVVEKLALVRGGKLDEEALEKIIEERAVSPFSKENVSTWLDTIEGEIGAIKACAGMVEGTQTKFVSNKTELDREVLAANAKHCLCFVFTSLGRSDPYLRYMADYLDSPSSENIRDITPCSAKLWCFSPLLVVKMKGKAETFKRLAENMKDSRNVRFLMAAIANDKYQGATTYYYLDGTLFTDDFTFPRMPAVDYLKGRKDLLWYACDLTLDPNTANSHLTLSDDNKKAESGKEQKYSANPLRFDSPRQVLCKEKLTGQHYWEVEWSGHVRAGVAYSDINRKGTSASCNLGQNHLSWALDHEPRKGYSIMYNSKGGDVSVRSDGFKRLGVFLDKGAGTLSFYMVSSDELHHIHTFRTKFSEPLYPAFRLGSNTDNGQVKLL